MMDISQTSFGQIEIFDNYFKDLDTNSIIYSPSECVERKISYSGTLNGREIPIMIGSKLNKHKDNPLNIYGYFIIKGMFYSVNNMLLKFKNNFSKDRAYLLNGSKIAISQMFDYYIVSKGKRKKWNIPINWKDIVKHSEFKDELTSHFTMIETFSNLKKSEPIKNEVDLKSICNMFECWLGLIEEPHYNYRLITPGEVIYDNYKFDNNIIKCFTTSKWSVKYIKGVTSVSELMKHYNVIGDIESIRRITYPANRENMSLVDRQVKMFNKNKICPVQSPDGKFCGTVYYLCKNARVTIEDETSVDIEKGNIFMFLNGEFFNKVSKNYIDKLNGDKIFYKDYCYISNLKGRIVPGDYLSYTASLIPYFNYNPPVRASFACSMLKQALMSYDRDINDTKILLKGDLGHDLYVAIMLWKGFNIEDSVIISESAANLYKYKRVYIYRESESKVVDTFVKKGKFVAQGSLLYKTFNPKEIKTIENVYSKQSGYVTEIKNEAGLFRLKLEQIKNLQVGDKMTSRHGQKGVVSKILKDSEMPRTDDRTIDLIVNPHAFPSRMTMGQLKEMGEKLEWVYVDNKKVKNKAIVGKCKYLSLRHQVDDKLQFSNDNGVNDISKQPLEGKRNKGGLRFGQMERDLLLALGADKTLQEIWKIDLVKIHKCEKTGKFFPKCCKIEVKMHQYFVICLSYIRALGYDILLKNNKYSITKINLSDFEETTNINFGSDDPSKLMIYRNMLILPLCLRSVYLNKLYTNSRLQKNKIEKEIRKLLMSKNGAYHKFFEGHRSNHCLRSVITPDPTLPLDTIKIPIGTNIGTDHCLLNRQPSLNIDSLALMKIKYKLEKTISINPLLCKSFNADFDGDEMNLFGIEDINEIKQVLKSKPQDTQDYILAKYLGVEDIVALTYVGITANKEGMELMVKSGSKGKEFNLKHIYESIGKVTYNDKDYHIEGCYYNGLGMDEWYILAMITRNNTASIALNTPVAGYLQSICNLLLL